MSRQASRKPQLQHKHTDNTTTAETADFENLLLVGGFTINRRQIQNNNNQRKRALKDNRKASHKQLAIKLEKVKESNRFKVVSSRSPIDLGSNKVKKTAKQTQHNQVPNHQYKQNVKSIHKPLKNKQPKSATQQAKQQKQVQNEEHQTAKTLQVQNHFVQKKMKIGHKSKSDAMKQFIIETLMKAKAEGNILTINKGTAQCVNSPRREYNRSQIAHNSKEKYSLVLVQQKGKSVVPKRKPFLPPLPGNQLKIQKPQSRNVSNIPSVPKNKKWVAMVRKMQKKESNCEDYKEEKKQSQQQQAQEIIQQNIVDQNASEIHVPIPEEIQQ